MRDEGSAPQPQDAQEGNTFAPTGDAPHGNNYGRPGKHLTSSKQCGYTECMSQL